MQEAAAAEILPEIDDFEIIDKIGEGGNAEIFKARQKSLDRFVAIKVLSPDSSNSPDMVRRFDRESTTIAGLNHPNIVHVIDKGKANGRYYFIMEYIDGTGFKEIISSGEYMVKDKLEMAVMALKGLDYAHKNGIIHRDIKPANILIDRQGNAMLADFGIAQIFNKVDYEVTKPDVIMGTLAYMSPEQRESSVNVDITTDIFSMGIIIYEILVGKRPVGRFKLPSEINSQISKRFDDIIVRSLAANPKDRYQTAVELKDDILDAISGRSWPGVGLWHSMVGVESFIGKCQFLDMIRESKFSSTMLVENKETHELYVIKKNEKYFIGLKEAKLLTKLKHENILNVYGAGGDLNRLVIVIEYAQGGSLADRMVKTYPYEKAMEVICQVAEGLNFAHKNGIIHGNLRPSNILFTRDEKVKVADFGLPPHYSKTTDKNWYAPPERRNNKQGDIYALGVILHQMVFGKNPIYDRSGRLFLGHLQKTIPAKLYAILSKYLSIRMSLRYRGIEEFIYEWEEFRNSLAKIEKPLTLPASFAKSRNQNRMLEIGIIAAGVIIIILLILLFSK